MIVAAVYGRPFIKWQDIDLPLEQTPKLDDVRSRFLDLLKQHLEHYFPTGNLADFDTLTPKKMPSELLQLRFDSIEKVSSLEEDGANIRQHWPQLIESIASNVDTCRFRDPPQEPAGPIVKHGNIAWGKNLSL